MSTSQEPPRSDEHTGGPAGAEPAARRSASGPAAKAAKRSRRASSPVRKAATPAKAADTSATGAGLAAAPVAPVAGRQGRARPEAGTAPSARAHRVDRFPFRFHPLLAPAALAVGVTPFTAHVDVDDHELRVRFGPWSLRTPLSNVTDVRRTGPYAWWKVVGPARVSAADRGVTFATTTEAGVCLRFREPVPAALPGGVLRHPGATVTVGRPDELVELLAARTAGPTP